MDRTVGVTTCEQKWQHLPIAPLFELVFCIDRAAAAWLFKFGNILSMASCDKVVNEGNFLLRTSISPRSTKMFSFGQQQQQPAKKPFGSSFGSTSSTLSLFGQQQQQQQQQPQQQQQQQPNAAPSFGFGAQPAASTTPFGGFGSQTAAATLGQTTQTPAFSLGLNASSNPTALPSTTTPAFGGGSSLFAPKTTATPSMSFGFGQSQLSTVVD